MGGQYCRKPRGGRFKKQSGMLEVRTDSEGRIENPVGFGG